METKKRICKICKKIKNASREDFYWNNANEAFERTCKECRKESISLMRLLNYNKNREKERERALRRKQTGVLVGDWKRWREKYPEKYKARYMLKNAVKAGKIKKGECKDKFGECYGTIHGHHHDYSKPFDVIWLCQKHHQMRHRVHHKKLSIIKPLVN